MSLGIFYSWVTWTLSQFALHLYFYSLATLCPKEFSIESLSLPKFTLYTTLQLVHVYWKPSLSCFVGRNKAYVYLRNHSITFILAKTRRGRSVPERCSVEVGREIYGTVWNRW